MTTNRPGRTDGDAPPVPVIPVHPERTDDPATLSWQLGRGLAALDAATTAPLRRLEGDGILAGFTLGPDHVRTTLAPGKHWADVAGEVRAAVQRAVRDDDLRLAAAGPAERDAVVARVARQVVTDVVAPVATSHGGTLEVVDVHDGVVAVRMLGTCHGCPASSATLHGLLEREVRRLLPGIAGIRVSPQGTGAGPPMTGAFPFTPHRDSEDAWSSKTSGRSRRASTWSRRPSTTRATGPSPGPGGTSS